MSSNLRFQANVLKALLETTEAFLIHLFEEANQCDIYAKHVTVMPKDFYLMQKLAGVCFNLVEIMNCHKSPLCMD